MEDYNTFTNSIIFPIFNRCYTIFLLDEKRHVVVLEKINHNHEKLRSKFAWSLYIIVGRVTMYELVDLVWEIDRNIKFLVSFLMFIIAQ